MVVPDLLRLEQSIVCCPPRFSFPFHSKCFHSVFEYTYLLFWNSFWTIAPVIALGLFDRCADDHVLMALPELYSHSRQGEYFNLKLFLLYMIDGCYQVRCSIASSITRAKVLLVYHYFLLPSLRIQRPNGSDGRIRYLPV